MDLEIGSKSQCLSELASLQLNKIRSKKNLSTCICAKYNSKFLLLNFMLTWVWTLFSMLIQCKNSQMRAFPINLASPLLFLPRVGKNCERQRPSWCTDREASKICSTHLCMFIQTDKTYMVRTLCYLVITLSSQTIAFMRCSWSGSYTFWSIFYLLQLSYLKLWNLPQSHSFSSFSPT